MAESVVGFVLGKLGDAFVKEVLHLYGVNEQVEKVSRELTRIQAFLKDADTKRIVNESQKQWVKEVRDLAYWIEDVIDTFLSEAPEKKPGKREAVKRFLNKTKNLPAVRRLGDEINRIEVRIQEIEASRVRYGITNIGEGVEGEIGQPVKRIVLPDVDEAGIVGLEADREKIVSLLLDEKTTGRSVISIVGTGGLGKTTLARKVYNSEVVKKQFDIRMWVTVSQKFDMIDVLKKTAEQLQIQPPKDLSEHQLTNLYQSLAKKRYLLVLDDIWAKKFWNQIEGVIPDENNGSRTLITTRFADVALEAYPLSVPYTLQFLTKEQSLELLMKKALPNRNAIEGYPDDLYNVGKELAKRCGGLPLALVVLGGLLSRKPANCVAWRRVMETMDWGTDGEECIAIIGTSYEDLPFALKSCFMYFAAFPGDCEIYVEFLLRMWVAEGFIPQQENKTLEDTAEMFLEDLAQRSMVQVTRRDFDGSIIRCRIHDVLHDLAIQKARDDNFLMSFSKADDVQNYSQTRRLASHDTGPSELMASATQNLRSLLCREYVPNISHLMRLKVLSYDIIGYSAYFDEYEPNKFGRLSQLRYFQVGLFVRSEHKNYFRNFISGMRFLQTLDLSAWGDWDLPDCIWHIKTLRHVLLFNGTLGPPPSVDLQNLQTLCGVKPRELWGAHGLPKLPNVKYLIISSPKQDRWDIIITLLCTMGHLITLHICGDDVPSKIIAMRCFPFYHCLQNLQLVNNNKVIALDVGMLPKFLIKLTLSSFEFREDPFPVLEKLENLRSLDLLGSYELLRLCCYARGFGQLEVLLLYGLINLEEWKIEEGAMPMLKKLVVASCRELRVPLGLQYLTILQELRWLGVKFSETEQYEIRSICSHVSSVEID